MGLRGSMGNWGPEVFEMREMLKPEPGVNEVLVRVHATSVNPVDAKVRQAGSWAVQPPDIIGYDVSGVIETIGEGVVDFVVGNVSSRTCYYSPDSQKA
jgi:NADPH2:quinone reductase